jgi:hypothetical protein
LVALIGNEAVALVLDNFLSTLDCGAQFFGTLLHRVRPMGWANGPGPALRLRVDKFPKVIDLPCATAKSAKSKAFTLKGQMATSDRRGEQLWRRQRELRARRHAPPAGRDGKWHALLAGRDGRRRALLAEQDGRSHALSAARGGRWHAPFARLDGRWRAPLARRDRRWWTPSANISFCFRRAKTNRCSALLFCIG